MRELWKKVFDHYAKISRDILDDFNPPAEPIKIEALESLTNGLIPALYQTFFIHNGQNSYRFACMHPWKLYDIDDVLDNYDLMNNEVVARWQEEDISPDDYSESNGPVKEVMWNSKWIPIASNGAGDLMCVDLDPAEGGKVGQVITWYHETTFKIVEASSYKEWLENYLQDLENNAYFFAEGKGLVKNKLS